MTDDQRDETRYDIALKDEAGIRGVREAVTVPRGGGALVKHNPLQRYLSEIRRNPLLGREDEKELARRVQEDNDQAAVYRLVVCNLRLVVKIALKYKRFWKHNMNDLIQEGNIGLLRAARKYDPTHNVKFSYYAAFWIKAYILKFIMDNWRLVRIGTTQGQRKLFYNLKKEKQKLVEEGFTPETKLLSSRLGVSEQEVSDMDQRLAGWDLSLDEPLKDDSDKEQGDFLSSHSESIENQVARREVKSLVREKASAFKKQLSDRELDIFENRIFTDTHLTLQELGEIYQISRERVRQLEKNIIKKLRSFFEKEIPDFCQL